MEIPRSSLQIKDAPETATLMIQKSSAVLIDRTVLTERGIMNASPSLDALDANSFQITETGWFPRRYVLLYFCYNYFIKIKVY